MSILKKFKLALSGGYDKLTEGSINTAIFMLAVPMIFEMVGESLFGIVDGYFVSQLGAYARNTISYTEIVIYLIFSVAMGITIAVNALVSRRVGEQEFDKASSLVFQSIIFTIFISILVSFIGFFFAKDLLILFGAGEETVVKGSFFMQLMIVGNLPIFLLFVLGGALRGAGYASIAMKALLIGNLINIVLDPFLIFGIWIFPEMGVDGAAVASLIGRGFGAIIQIYFIQQKRSLIRIKKGHFKIVYKTIYVILKIGTNGMVQSFVGTVGWVFLTIISGYIREDAPGTLAIVLRIFLFLFLPTMGVANAVATLVGQNLGAKKPERAEKTVWRAAHLNTIYLLLISIIYLVFAENMVALFFKNEVDFKIATDGLKIIAIGNIFYGYGMIMSQAFNGAGDSKTPMYLNIFCFIIVQTPLALLITDSSLGETGIYIVITFSYSLMAILAIILFRKGKWKLKEV